MSKKPENNTFKKQEAIKKTQHKDQLQKTDLDKMLFKVFIVYLNIKA